MGILLLPTIEMRYCYLEVLIWHLHSLFETVCSIGTTADTSGDTTIQLGSLLDDGQWHDVEVTRKEQNLSLTVDRLTMKNVTNGDFYQLDLDRRVTVSVHSIHW